MAGAAPGGGGGGPLPLPPPLILPAPLGSAPAAPAVPAGYQHVAYAPVPLIPHPHRYPKDGGFSVFGTPGARIWSPTTPAYYHIPNQN